MLSRKLWYYLVLLILMNNIGISLMELSSSVCPSVGCSKSFKIGHYIEMFQPNLFIPAILISTIDRNHLIPLSMSLTMDEGHKVSGEQNLSRSVSHTVLNLSERKLTWSEKQIKLSIIVHL